MTIGGAEEVRITSLTVAGTLRKPVIVWLVREGDDVYVRSVNGRDARWFRRVRERQEGCDAAAGVERNVTFVETTNECPRLTPSIGPSTATLHLLSRVL